MKKVLFIVLLTLSACTKEVIVEVPNPVNQQLQQQLNELQNQISNLQGDNSQLMQRVNDLSAQLNDRTNSHSFSNIYVQDLENDISTLKVELERTTAFSIIYNAFNRSANFHSAFANSQNSWTFQRGNDNSLQIKVNISYVKDGKYTISFSTYNQAISGNSLKRYYYVNDLENITFEKATTIFAADNEILTEFVDLDMFARHIATELKRT